MISLPKLGGKLPPRTARLAVPPRSVRQPSAETSQKTCSVAGLVCGIVLPSLEDLKSPLRNSFVAVMARSLGRTTDGVYGVGDGMVQRRVKSFKVAERCYHPCEVSFFPLLSNGFAAQSVSSKKQVCCKYFDCPSSAQTNFVRPGIAIGCTSTTEFQSLISGTSTCCEPSAMSQVICCPV